MPFCFGGVFARAFSNGVVSFDCLDALYEEQGVFVWVLPLWKIPEVFGNLAVVSIKEIGGQGGCLDTAGCCLCI